MPDSDCPMKVAFFIAVALLLASRTVCSEETLSLKRVSTERVVAAVETAHTILWSKFIGDDGLIHDYVGELPTPEDCELGRPNAIGWWSPIENGPMFTGTYLVAMCERARRSQAAADRDKARRLAQGLLACASVSDVPGFIARGMGTDGKCHYPMGSQDQTHPWFYGLHAYATSGIPTAQERKIVVDKMNEVAKALEAVNWKCPCDGAFKGQFRGDFALFRHHGAVMYLFILRAMYDVTGDRAWLERYQKAMQERCEKTGKTRLEICAEGYPYDREQIKNIDRALLWIYVSSQGALARLAGWETDEQAQAQYRAGLAVNARGALAVIDAYKTFDNSDTKVFGHARWREGYPQWFPQKTQTDAERMAATGDRSILGERKSYEASRMRNPLAAAALIALAGHRDGFEAVRSAICHYHYAKLNMAEFFFAECAFYALPAEQADILTPPPTPEPRINGAKVFGVRPGRPLLYTIAATGRRPMTFSVADLPDGLQIDETTGRITGSLAERGTYRVMLRAENALGQAERELRIIVGDELLLTPLLGCNTWGGWGAKVTDANLRAAAKAMVDTGLIHHGWQYINIDDGWQGHRGGPYKAILPNEKFPDMTALCDDIHRLGLKAGIYSTPWTTSYAGFLGGSSDDADGAWQRPQNRRDGWRVGKYLFETNDARQWAAWGFDYVKYDWGVDRVELTRRMADALTACDRDIVMELSNSVPLDKAAAHTSLAQLSRTTGDLVDFWDRSQMPPEIRGWAEGIREVWLAHDAWAPFQRPGHWNHACNLRIGLLGGWRDKPLTPTHLTPDEQYTHISLWCLWGSPMIIGTPIERLDPFTLSLLSNDDVLEINQDPLGVQGRRAKTDGGEAVVKPLEDGSKAVGLLNPGNEPATVSIDWSTLGLKGKQRVRDLWRQEDLGICIEKFTAEVRPHGVVLVRLTPAAVPD